MPNMPEERSKKFQWVSLAYLVFFMLAVFSPSIVNDDYLGIPHAQLEEILIFIFGLLGIMIFMLYERLMERKEKENKEVSDAHDHAKKELVASYQYIGSINRQLDLLKKSINDTSVSMYDQHKLSKELLHSLVEAASASFGGTPTLLRFVNLEKLRTESEFAHPTFSLGRLPFTVSNKDLKTAHEQGAVTRVTTDKVQLVLVPSDRRNGGIKAFIVVQEANNGSEYDASLLRVFVNQAELIYRGLQGNKSTQVESAPLDQVEAVTKIAEGEVE
ncbi:MAG: hypothetical protein ACYC44_04760 [Patescibacteria group bacterium]